MSPFKNTTVFVDLLDKVESFMLTSSEEVRQETAVMIGKLGNLPHEKELRELVDKNNRIFEARGSTKDFWIRGFWFWHKPPEDNSNIVLTHLYLKKENKTDQKEIKVAVVIKKKYEAFKAEEYKKLKNKKR